MRSFLLVGSMLAWSATSAAQPTFTLGVDLVRFGVTVLDEDGDFVTDLTEEDFEVYEEGVKQEIRYFASALTPQVALPPLHLGLLLDTSGSMDEDLHMARTAAIKFLNALTRAEDITLVDFDNEVRVGRYRQADFPRLVERIRNREPEGWTAMYDALGVYLDGAEAQDGQKILILYSDGADTRSALSYSDALDLVRASDVTIYCIGFVGGRSRSDRMLQRMRLERIVELTGGRAYFPLSADPLDEIYEEIASEIAARYSFGYASTDPSADGMWRRVEIKLNSDRRDTKDLKIRARAGYFGPYLPAGQTRW